MKKVIKIGFPIACIAIIGGTFYMLGNLDKKVDDSLRKQYSNSIQEENTTQNEIINQEDVTYTVPVEFDTDETTEDSDEENTSSNTESSENNSNIVENDNTSNKINNDLSNNSNIAENNN